MILVMMMMTKDLLLLLLIVEKRNFEPVEREFKINSHLLRTQLSLPP